MKRYLIFAGMGLIALLLLFWLLHYLTFGTVIIKTDNPSDTITLTKIDDSTAIKKGSGKLSQSLHSGGYVATVDGVSTRAKQLVQVRAHKEAMVVIHLVGTASAEPVAAINARSVSVNSQTLMYLNKDSGGLYQIDAQNNQRQLSSHPFEIVKWSSPAFGVAQDKNRDLYTVSSGGVNRLALPVSGADDFAVNPQNNIYFSHGRDIYLSTAGSNFKKIYTASADFSSLTASANSVAIVYNQSAENIKSKKPYISVVDDSGKVATKKNISAFSVLWSPDSKRLAVLSGDKYSVLDEKLNKVVDIPNSAVSNPAWLNSHALIYSAGEKLWSFDTTSGKAYVVANMPLNSNAVDIALDRDRSYIYLTVTDDNNISLKRVGLNHEAVADFIYQLDALLPAPLDKCYVDYTNFNGMTVFARPEPGSPPQVCVDNARAELQRDGIDISQLSIRSPS